MSANAQSQMSEIDLLTHQTKLIEQISNKLVTAGGDTFFATLVEELAKALDVTYIIAGKNILVNGKRAVETLAFWVDGKLADNVTYDLVDTPCEDAMDSAICFHPCDIQKAYPEDVLLVEMNAESYVGASMFNTKGETIGLINAIDTKPMSNDTRNIAITLMTIFNMRGAAELEHQIHQQTLEDKVQQRTEELTRTNAQLERSMNELKNTQKRLIQSEKQASITRLVSGLAHQINTPLGILLTAFSQLDHDVKSVKKELNEAKLNKSTLLELLRDYDLGQELINTNLSKAIDLVDSLKQIANDPEDINQVDVQKLLEQQLNLWAPTFHQNGHELKTDIEPLPIIQSSPAALNQIFHNIIENALEHGFKHAETPKCLQITVQKQNQQLTISCIDDGKGLSNDEDLQKIFDPFNTQFSYQNKGLGLYIVASLVQQLNGQIDAQHNRPSGLKILINLPL